MGESGDRPHNTELRSFGRRRGRGMSARQHALLSQGLRAVRVDISAPAPGDARTIFEPNCSDVWLEIGFGGGEHLVWQAAHHPDTGFIGCEPFQDGVVKVLAAIEEQKIKNVRVYSDDARHLLRWLPAHSVGRAFILFPDPWPKKKHAKRRLFSPATLALLARVMKPGAELRLATDIGDYARTSLLTVTKCTEFRWLADGPSGWRDRGLDWPSTRYEAKAIREGRTCYFLRFQRV